MGEEGCESASFGARGRDCDVPDRRYVFVAEDLFLCSPREAGDVLRLSEIKSERASGLRFDYQMMWQMNRRLQSDDGKQSFLPLFWIRRQPAMLKIGTHLQFSALKEYGASMQLYTIV